MHDCWSAGLTISGAKSAIGISGINIVGFLCDYNGRLEEKKIAAIMVWPVPRSTKDARAFIGIVVYSRIFITSFAIIAAPIFELFRKGVDFSWTSEHQYAMDELKRRLTEPPILITLDFSPSALMIFLNVDASTLIGWGGILSYNLTDGYDRRGLKAESGVRRS